MVIDASVGVKWVVAEPNTDLALRLLDHDLMVPALFHSELINALWKKVIRGELAITSALSELVKVRLLAEQVDDADHVARALELAVELNHPVYDCVYLAAAEALDVKLVTADLRFLERVKATVHAGRIVALADFGAQA